MTNSGDGKTRFLGLDVGGRRIGVAISDRNGSLATPYNALTRHGLERDIAAILRLVQQEEVGTIVVGEPLSLDGTVGPQAKLTLAFCAALKTASPVPVDTWDERFSTMEAEGLLREAGVAPSRNRARLDAAAAAVILQGYLDAHYQPAT